MRPTKPHEYRTKRARELRRVGTGTEDILWTALRNRGHRNLKFRRQRPFGRYFFDFFCEELNFVIELDGEQHLDPAVAENDAKRTEFLQSRGLTLLRVSNEELLQSPEFVFARIDRVVDELRRLRNIAVGPREPSPGAGAPPSPSGEGHKSTGER